MALQYDGSASVAALSPRFEVSGRRLLANNRSCRSVDTEPPSHGSGDNGIRRRADSGGRDFCLSDSMISLSSALVREGGGAYPPRLYARPGVPFAKGFGDLAAAAAASASAASAFSASA